MEGVLANVDEGGAVAVRPGAWRRLAGAAECDAEGGGDGGERVRDQVERKRWQLAPFYHKGDSHMIIGGR
jgi:hypothetical protein